MSHAAEQPAECLRRARRIAVLTGAGISAESGIPTFRDALTGLWAKYNPNDLATAKAYLKDPALVSRWYDERRCQVAASRPNPGHLALARLQKIAGDQGKTFTLITQNIDRLHQAAGSTGVIELHGTWALWRCMDCGEESEETGPAFESYPPRCACGGLRRPGVVWFGEPLPVEAFDAAQDAVGRCELFLSVGTSSVVYPAAGLIELALRLGTPVLEVNPQETPFSEMAQWSIRGKSGDVLPRLVEEAFGREEL